MKHHSTVGIITNSSSVVYTWPAKGIEDNLLKVGQSILDALGTGQQAADVFEVSKTVNGECFDRFFDAIDEYVEDEELGEQLQDQRRIIDAKVRDEFDGKQWWEMDPAGRRLYSQRKDELFMELLATHGIVLPETTENYDGLELPNYDYFLVAKATGQRVDIAGFFNELYEQEASYNG